MYRSIGKRTLDIAVSGVALIVLAPVLVTIAGLIALTLGRPVLFQQQRGGRHSLAFDIVKFRTMVDANDSDGRPRPDAERLTRLGVLLRSTSLDELPSLWNVFKGEMSLVGPRPFIHDYVALYTPEQARRSEVRPGVTGWAQVNGRNILSWEERFELDVWYVDNVSLGLDLKIFLLTLQNVARRRGISASGQATMPRFPGTGSSLTIDGDGR